MLKLLTRVLLTMVALTATYVAAGKPGATYQKNRGETCAVKHLFDNVAKDFQGFTGLRAPATVELTPMTQGRFIWDHSDAPMEQTYSGELRIRGTFYVFVPQGEQEQIWADLPDKINFFVKDLVTGEVMERSNVLGGWNIARMGISISPADMPPSDFNYSSLPANTIDSRTFSIEIFDNLATMPEPNTTLEIHFEYMGFKSDPLRVKTVLNQD